MAGLHTVHLHNNVPLTQKNSCLCEPELNALPSSLLRYHGYLAANGDVGFRDWAERVSGAALPI